MKKIITLFALSCLFFTLCKAQYVNLPDTNFRNHLQYLYPGCFNAAGEMDTTCTAIVNEDSLNFSNDSSLFRAENIIGIRYFKSLAWLNCYGQYMLKSLSELPATLLYMNCKGCQLSNVDTLPNQLQYLDCSDNFTLRSMPLLPASLSFLDFTNNDVQSLTAPLPSSLEHIAFSHNGVTLLPALPPRLKYLNFGFNRISTVPSLPDSINLLDCSGNILTELPALPPNLEKLDCSYNDLVHLPELPSKLKELICLHSLLTGLPPLPNGLTNLTCSNNPLGNYLPGIVLPDSLQRFDCSTCGMASLPALPTHLKTLSCWQNQLTSLPALPGSLELFVCHQNNIYCFPKIPEPLTPSSPGLYLVYDDDKIKCLPNFSRGLDLHPAHNTVTPLCSPLNNINHCQAYPVISGRVFVDSNSNGIKDANEQYKANVKVVLSDGKITFSNSNGYFEIGASDTGTHTISVTAPTYFTAFPSMATYNFTSYDTVVYGDYALQLTTPYDSLTIKITPVIWAARPGFSFPYAINYENTGFTTLSPAIVFDYDETRLVYDSSSIAGVVDNATNLSYNTGVLIPGQNGNFIGYFTLKTTVPLDDTLNAKAIISTASYAAYDSVQTIVRGSYDPNDKQATPQLSPLQVANGKYIDYTIRFQNTGTDTAFNIVVSDTLNENLQANTLEMVVASHTCKTSVKNNIVFFEFLNILLPDSNVNEKASHGFVSFRIKPQTTVLPNTTIPNKAAIYFDYNSPVITNIAGTLIKDFTVIPLKLVSFSAVPQTDNTTTLYWATANEINTKQFTIEQSTDGNRFNAIRNIAAKEKATNEYSANVPDANNSFVYYRLKIVDNNGTFAYSPIIKIDRRKNTAGIAVLTNPVKDFIVISTSDGALFNTHASIINTNGAVVKSFIIKQGSQTVEVKGLPTGVYYLRTANGSSRVVIQ